MATAIVWLLDRLGRLIAWLDEPMQLGGMADHPLVRRRASDYPSRRPSPRRVTIVHLRLPLVQITRLHDGDQYVLVYCDCGQCDSQAEARATLQCWKEADCNFDEEDHRDVWSVIHEIGARHHAK